MSAKHNGTVWLSSDGSPTKLYVTETVCGGKKKKCTCGKNDMQQRIVDLFHKLRTTLGFPLTVNSGFRCPEYNATLEGAKKQSQHLLGKALDIALPTGMSADTMEYHMETAGATAIGKYKTFCHMDEREGQFRWDYRNVK